MRSLLEESSKQRPEGPGLWIMDNCSDGFIRTVDKIMMDDKNPDDIDTSGEDHALDDARYFAVTATAGIMSISRSNWG